MHVEGLGIRMIPLDKFRDLKMHFDSLGT